MSARIRAHLRSNIVGYVAIFLFATSGTAMALSGSNTVFSDDIVNGEVTSPDILDGSIGKIDIRDGSMDSAKVQNDSLTGADIANTGSVGSPEVGGLDGGDIADTDSVSSPEVGGLNGGDITDGTLSGADITDDSITPADTTGLVGSSSVLWAVVNVDGAVSRSSNGAATGAHDGTGDYEIDFHDGSLDGCASLAQISETFFTDGAPGPGEAASGQGSGDEFHIDVRTFNSAGTAADSPFTVHVLCGTGGGARSSR
jgi:hypothetical protein